MNVETLKDYLGSESIFAAIDSVESFPFLQGETGALDTLLTLKYGQRPLFSALTGETVDDVATFIVAHFADAWNQYEELSNIPLAHSSSKTIETLDGTESEVEDEGTTHQVAAFNASTFVDEHGDTRARESDTVHGYVKETDVRNYRDGDLERLYSSARRSTLNRVIYDVGTFLTLSIY